MKFWKVCIINHVDFICFDFIWEKDSTGPWLNVIRTCMGSVK